MNYGTGRLITTRCIKEEELCTDPRRLCETQIFLERYALAVRMLRLCRNDERSRKRDDEKDPTFYHCVGGDANYWQNQMQEVRAFIDSLPNRSCKMLLYYHYIQGLTVERASEELDISRRNAFRLKKRAMGFAAARLEDWLKERGSQSPAMLS